MADKFKKIDKEFLLTDSSLNCYGFRLLTAGYKIDEFKKNPIGYYMHDRDKGVLVKWDDLRVNGDQVYGKPCINLSNPRGQQTVDEIESGFLNAASFGHFVVEEMSDDSSLKLPGQTGVTVTKWYNRESSLVDIPGNFNALTQLFDKNDNPITLSDLTDTIKFNSKNMSKQIILLATSYAALNLSADEADATVVDTAIANLSAQNKKLKGDIVSKDNDIASKVTEINNLKTAAETKKMEDLEIVMKAKKLATPEIDKYKKLAATSAESFNTVKEIIDGLPSYGSIENKLNTGGNGMVSGADEEVKELMKLSGHDLYMQDKFPRLQALSPEHYKLKYKEYYGHELPA